MILKERSKKGQALVIGIVAIVLVAVAIIAFSGGDDPSTSQEGQNPDSQSGQQDNADGTGSGNDDSGTSDGTEAGSGQEHIVEMSASGFTPQELTIEQGDTVTFENVGSSAIWPAVDRHPTHTQYDGTSTSEHCSDGAGPDTFDACRGVPPGETYKFTFDKTGEWTYHDHKAAYNTGTIIVE